MGMFDKPPKLADDYPPNSGKAFTIHEAAFIGYDESFGNPNAVATVEVSETPEGKQSSYKIYGKLAEQVARMESGDLPATVTIEKFDRANVFVPVNVEQDITL
jgi:hypothetical protein